MISKATALGALLAISAAMPASLSAATYDVDFRGDTVPQESLLFDNAGGSSVSLTLRASDFAYHEGNLTDYFDQSLSGGAGAFTDGKLYVGQYAMGLGVCSGTVIDTGYYCSGDLSQIDGYGTDIARTVGETALEATGAVGASDEMVLFMFDQTVRLLSVSFELFDTEDRFVFRTFDPLGDYLTGLDANGSGTETAPTYLFSGGVLGKTFGIGARENSSDFRITGLTFEYVAPVPLPASLPLLLAGVGGLALLRRRARG